MLISKQNTIPYTGNNLLPVFLKGKISILIFGGDENALYTVKKLLQNADASIKVVATSFVREFDLPEFSEIKIVNEEYNSAYLDESHLAIITSKDSVLSDRIRFDAHLKKKLVCLPHAKHLSDFQFGEIVEKGNLKIAISANGSDDVALELKDTLQGYFQADVEKVDIEDLDKEFKNFDPRFDADKNIGTDKTFTELHWKRIASFSILAFFFMILGHLLLSYLPISELQLTITDAVQGLDKTFLLMIVAGFTAQMIDGALGMGYGVTCTTFLLSLGINLPAISGSIHTAEMFSSAASGYSHYRFGNVNKKLFRALLIPGIIGAVAGAWLLSTLGKNYADYVRPVLAMYTLFLGLKIFSNAFIKNRGVKKVKRVGWLAGAGGFLDSFGGGGWGPLVTSTLIAKGKTPKYVIGTVSVTEFFVTFASALTFFSLIGLSHWEVILGLIIGGVIAAPFAARLAGKLPVKTMFITVGIMVIIWSLRIILKSFGVF